MNKSAAELDFPNENYSGLLMTIRLAFGSRSCVRGAQAFSLPQATGRRESMSLAISSFHWTNLIFRQVNLIRF